MNQYIEQKSLLNNYLYDFTINGDEDNSIISSLQRIFTLKDINQRADYITINDTSKAFSMITFSLKSIAKSQNSLIAAYGQVPDSMC